MNAKPRSPRRRHEGFSLIVTVTMMVLLSLVAVALLSLSATTIRSSRADQARNEARANARLALMMAIGELQRTLGTDLAATANADAIHASTSQSGLLGVWKSWHYDPETPNAPSQKKNNFQRWMASAPSQQSESIQWGASQPSNPVTLFGKNGGQNVQQVQAAIIPIGDEGSFAWAVRDESLRAPVHLNPSSLRDPNKNLGDEIANRAAPARVRVEEIAEGLAPRTKDDDRIAKMATLSTAVLATGVNDPAIRDQITVNSIGLLTDSAEGGLRRDLTTIMESDLDAFRVVDPDSDKVRVYGENNTVGTPSWEFLQERYQLYKRFSSTSDGTPLYSVTRQDMNPTDLEYETDPTTERILPVISRFQMVFSVVSHHPHISDRVTFLNTKGDPRGNINYGAAHLVYEPIITLYNPYDVQLRLNKLRVRVYDPPVVFGFKKNSAWLRPEFARGDYHGLARFQIANEKNTAARKYFTLSLSDMRGRSPGAPIVMEPGEVRVFSSWVEPQWTWALEANGYSPRVFFDWNYGNDFGNKDSRTNNAFGVEAVPGWDPRAGLQTDHLSYANGRPGDTLYGFETQNGFSGGFVHIKVSDTFSVYCRPGRTISGTGTDNEPDFRVDLLANIQTSADRDLIRSHQFRFGDPKTEIGGLRSEEIVREFLVSDILQTERDRDAAGKSPFALLTMSAKTTKEPRDNYKPWLFNNPVVEGTIQDARGVGNALDSYDLRLDEITDFNTTFPSIEIDPKNRGYFGASGSRSYQGVSNVPMFRAPSTPALSLGDWTSANLINGAALPRVTRPLGSGAAHPLIPVASAIGSATGSEVAETIFDHSLFLNDALWDSFFFSTLADFGGSVFTTGSRERQLRSFFNGEEPALNQRLTPAPGIEESSTEIAQRLDQMDDISFAREIAAYVAINGPFNVNSTSAEAWAAVLGSTEESSLTHWGGTKLNQGKKASFPRSLFPLAGDADQTDSSVSLDVQGAVRWAGYRSLENRGSLDALAESIIESIREKSKIYNAPSLSLSDFVNRSPDAGADDFAQNGLLQVAIDRARINSNFYNQDGQPVDPQLDDPTRSMRGIANRTTLEGNTAEGAPSFLTQGDLLSQLAPIITTRGDTFTIRTYGTSKAKNGQVLATARAEATVQRIPAYLDEQSDQPYVQTDELRSQVNRDFGRRFVLTSFRWLADDEV